MCGFGGKTGTSAFRCKKCRRLVAVQDNVVDHIPGQGETSFEWRKRKGSNYNNFEDFECSSIFVEPLKWMTAVEEGAMEGKLSCASNAVAGAGSPLPSSSIEAEWT
ncbi:putative protein-tyrosine-phosphatase [Rosa chinensis]|uniref:protein-tyrosine-phosphatase n=2 Tax=Rosa chinensis TaxID=74649 RepID=A0A2P6SD81_ROSCH|nr:putative protein-tyrosine-phosphatase [Rosa chinensis]